MEERDNLIITGIVLLFLVGIGTIVLLFRTTLRDALKSVAAEQQDIVGVWKDSTYDEWYRFDDDGSWYGYSDEGMFGLGNYELADDSLIMYMPEGSVYNSWTVVDNGLMNDYDSKEFLDPSSLPKFTESETDAAGVTGIWEYRDEHGWLVIYENGSWCSYSAADYSSSGTVELSGDGSVNLVRYGLTEEDDTVEMTLTLQDADTLIDRDGAELQRRDKISLNSAALPEELLGVWQLDGLWYEFTEDGTWRCYNDVGTVLEGRCTVIDTQCVSLRMVDGTRLMLWSADETDAVPGTLPDFTQALPEAFAGAWYSMADDCRLVIYPGGTWFLYYNDQYFLSAGFAHAGADDDTIVLTENIDDTDEDAWMTLTLGADGELTDDNGNMLYSGEVSDMFSYDGALDDSEAIGGSAVRGRVMEMLEEAGAQDSIILSGD